MYLQLVRPVRVRNNRLGHPSATPDYALGGEENFRTRADLDMPARTTIAGDIWTCLFSIDTNAPMHKVCFLTDESCHL